MFKTTGAKSVIANITYRSINNNMPQTICKTLKNGKIYPVSSIAFINLNPSASGIGNITKLKSPIMPKTMKIKPNKVLDSL